MEDDGGLQAGAAYILQRDEGGVNNWGEVKKLLASDADSFDAFGGFVAISGDTVVVGARGGDDGGEWAGAAYVFQRDQGGTDNWGEVKKLTASDPDVNDFFGKSVALSADTAIVGSYLEDSQGEWAGAAYVFGRDQGRADNWGEVKKLTASDAAAGDWFGESVALSGDTALVGSQREDGASLDVDFNAGAAYVFGRNQGGGDNWGEVKKLTASDAEAGDSFGSVALSGDTAVVGANGEDAGGDAAGAAYVFERNDGGADNWGEVKKLTASDAQAFDAFGRHAAVSGDTVLVGSVGADTGGAAYLFGRDQGGAENWGQVIKPTASDPDVGDAFGVSVAIRGDTALVGAPGGDTGAPNAGAAYLFDLLQPKPTPCPVGKVPVGGGCGTPTPTPTPKGPDGDTDGDTIPNSSDPDDDNDGCTDERELGPNRFQGGLRNPHYFWDFMDQFAPQPDSSFARNRLVNIIDIGAIVARLFSLGDPNGDPLDPPQALTGYHVSADRSAPIGPNVWNAGPPDGVINVIEIGLVVAQFKHDCTEP